MEQILELQKGKNVCLASSISLDTSSQGVEWGVMVTLF